MKKAKVISIQRNGNTYTLNDCYIDTTDTAFSGFVAIIRPYDESNVLYINLKNIVLIELEK